MKTAKIPKATGREMKRQVYPRRGTYAILGPSSNELNEGLEVLSLAYRTELIAAAKLLQRDDWNFLAHCLTGVTLDTLGLDVGLRIADVISEVYLLGHAKRYYGTAMLERTNDLVALIRHFHPLRIWAVAAACRHYHRHVLEIDAEHDEWWTWEHMAQFQEQS